MTVHPTEVKGTYFVGYYIDLRENPPTCDCAAGVRDKPCHHVPMAQAFAKGEVVPFWETR